MPKRGLHRNLNQILLPDFITVTNITPSDGGGGGGNGSMSAAVAEVEAFLNYSFHDEKLLEEALTHSSHPDHPSYQRLEFVGDAALTLAFTNYLFLTNPGLGPGRLSMLRSANISTEKLARVAVHHGLYRFLRRNSPKLDQMVCDFTAAVMREMEEDSSGVLYGGSSIKAPKVLADIVESIAAAVYVDCNFNLEMLWKVFRGILEPIITSETLDDQPISLLYEICQKHGMTLDFKNWKKGTMNITNVFVDKKLLGIGSSEQKVIAKLNAAKDALQKLVIVEPVDMELDSSVSLVKGAGEEKGGSKHRLVDLCRKNHWPKPVYKVETEDGPSHDKKYICSVQVETADGVLATHGGINSRVKDAENSAASMILEVLDRVVGVDDLTGI